MNQILDLQQKSNLLSSMICTLCKPLMLNKEFSNHVRQLLSSESDLRLTIDLIMEVKTEKEMREKITLAIQESEIILYTLMQMDKKKINNISPIIEQTNEIIGILNTL
ncbi:MAG: hypothetical protein PHE13_01945 [Bacteroidales bacterium]|jgi:hypothetical protein|nr:hypothetical protein [Bacteroidales bacterium]MDD4829245.1 hypothetical protein [Bacteroidales bacterium]